MKVFTENDSPAIHLISAESSVRLTEEQLASGSGLTAGSREYWQGFTCCPARFVALQANDP